MSISSVPAVLMMMFVSSLPPSLEQVQDDTDVPDAAFVDLIEYVEGATRDESVELRIDHAAILDDPNRYRGSLVTISGRLEQHRTLGRPFEAVGEWFIRDDSGQPWAVYVIDVESDDVRDGRYVTLSGLVYKRLRLDDRSGVERTFPALIASSPTWSVATAPVSAGRSQLWLLVAVLAIGLIVVIILGRRLARHPSSRPVIVAADDDEPMELPEEPSEALRELKRRGDSHTT